MSKILPVDKIIHGYVDDFGCTVSIIFPKAVVDEAIHNFMNRQVIDDSPSHLSTHLSIYNVNTCELLGNIRNLTFDPDGDLCVTSSADLSAYNILLDLDDIPHTIYQTYVNDTTGSSMNVFTVREFRINGVDVSLSEKSRFLTGHTLSPDGYRIKRFDEF